ncbi:MAG: DUF1573 domain-containing protein [Bacteroidales bacterium]|nr:DUF1573 domain-containing protein [Bacteroidales bacterium]
MKKFFLLMGILLSIGLVSNAQTEQTNQNVTDSSNAEIAFETLVHDYGKVEFGADGSCEFKFKNTGTDPLVLNNVQSTCGCTVPEWPRNPIAPGQSASIKVVYNTKRSGVFTKGITVMSNAKTATVRLTIKGEVAAQPDVPTLGQ